MENENKSKEITEEYNIKDEKLNNVSGGLPDKAFNLPNSPKKAKLAVLLNRPFKREFHKPSEITEKKDNKDNKDNKDLGFDF